MYLRQRASAVAFAVATLGMFSLAACSASPASEPSERSSSSTSEELVKGGGGGGLGFNCLPNGACICTGDVDCNRLFGTGRCDGTVNQCWERGPGAVYCTCYPPARAPH